MALRAVRIRTVIRDIGASDEQADDFVEAMGELPTKENIAALLAKQLNRILVAQIGIAGIVIGAVAMILHL